MQKKIEVCIGTDRAGFVRARLSLIVLDDNGAEMLERYHSVNLEPGSDLAATRAAVEAHLANPDGGIPGAPWPAIPDDVWDTVEKTCALIQTPAIIEAHQLRRAAAVAKSLGVAAPVRPEA